MNQPISRRFFGNESKYVQEVVDSEFRSSKNTKMTARLEAEFAKRFESPFAIAFVNGTATMHALLEARRIGPGDEVIVPPLTMSATCFAVLQANATPVFADVDPETFTIDPRSIESRITPQTKAIITVALYGLSPDMDPIMEIARRHDLLVIEDNAQCFLGSYKNRLVGTLGHAASFSFQSSKHITSGEGGMIVCKDRELAEWTRKVNSLGYAGVGASTGKISKLDIQDPAYSRHVTMGWNYRMSDLCAAVALAQLENIEPLIQRRIEVSRMFSDAAAGCDAFRPQKTPPGYVNSYWTFAGTWNHPKVSWHELRNKFLENGGDGVYAAWKLSHLEPMFQTMSLLGREQFISERNRRSYAPGLCPVAEQLQPRMLQFRTNYWDLARAEQQASALRKTLRFFL